MPKKTRKAKMRAAQRPVSAGYVPAAPVAAPTDADFTQPVPARAAAPASRSASASARAMTPVATDYSYVYRDLARIALLALIFFAIMFVLWFLVEVQHVTIIPGLF